MLIAALFTGEMLVQRSKDTLSVEVREKERELAKLKKKLEAEIASREENQQRMTEYKVFLCVQYWWCSVSSTGSAVCPVLVVQCAKYWWCSVSSTGGAVCPVVLVC